MKNARAKRAKTLFFIVKYANLWVFCCCRRGGFLSSLLSWNSLRKDDNEDFTNLHILIQFAKPRNSVRPSHVFFVLIHFFAVLCELTMLKCPIANLKSCEDVSI